MLSKHSDEPTCLSSLFLAADDFQSSLSAPLAGGLDAYLTGEDYDDFFDLHIVKSSDSEVWWSTLSMNILTILNIFKCS